MIIEKSRTSLPAYASPLLNRTSLRSAQINGEFTHPTFSILFNMTKTKAQSRVAELIVARAHAAGQEPLRYGLITIFNQTGEQRYQLRSNQNNALVAPQGKYSYVILANRIGGYELRIGKMHHYYLADKSFEVYAAGEIQFAPCDPGSAHADIEFINPCSGGYHTDEVDQLIRSIKNLSIVDVLESVGLPVHKFQPVSLQPTRANKSNRRLSL